MFELARSFGRGPVLMSTVAERQGLSRKHLHTLLTSLKKAELVQAIRGPGGGFVLARPPAEIRLSDILRAVEGPLSVVDCVSDETACDKAGDCAARQIWKEVSGAIEESLDRVTLEDMTELDDKDCPQSRGRKKRGQAFGKNSREA